MKLEATHMRCRSWCRLSRGLHPCSVYAARKPRGGREQQDALSERSSLRDTAYSPNPGATLSTQLAAKATLLCLDRFHRAVEVVERKWGGGGGGTTAWQQKGRVEWLQDTLQVLAQALSDPGTRHHCPFKTAMVQPAVQRAAVWHPNICRRTAVKPVG